MIRALWTAATGMQAQQLFIDSTSNNLANVNTVGFKKGRVDFQDLLYQTLRPAGAEMAIGTQIPTGIQIGHGTRPAALQKIFSPGTLQQTYNPLDLAIEGDGFFQISRPDGTTAYTRAGDFKMNSEGQMVTSDGFQISPGITFPAETIEIYFGADGTVSAVQADGTIDDAGGPIEIARFTNPAGLKALGRNLYMTTTASGEPSSIDQPGNTGLGTLAQGFLEMSNVSVVEEMVNLIIGQRAYEINSKAIQTSDDMLGIANNLKR